MRPRSARAARTASRFSPAWHLALGARGGGEMRGRRVTLTDVQTSSTLAPRHPASPVVRRRAGAGECGRARASWHYGPACGKLLRGKSRLRPGPRFVVTTGIRPERVGTIRVQLTPPVPLRDSRPAHRGARFASRNVRVSSEVSRRTERAVLCARHVAVVDRRHPRGGPHSSCSDSVRSYMSGMPALCRSKLRQSPRLSLWSMQRRRAVGRNHLPRAPRTRWPKESGDRLIAS